jgi:hypothetical protein
VRQWVGYERYESASACDALHALYEVVRLYVNFFQPSMKLVSKERVESRVKKRYDKAKTPYQRVLESAQLTEEVKARLRQQYAPLNPLALLRQMQRLQAVLWKLAAGEPTELETTQTRAASS